MASAAMPAIANFFMRTSFERLAEDEPAQGRIQLTVWTEWLLLPRCNVAPLSPSKLEHAERAGQPPRDFRHGRDDPKKDPRGQKPRPHRDRQFGDAHLGDAGRHVEIESDRRMAHADFHVD